jgi:hypothetical protein
MEKNEFIYSTFAMGINMVGLKPKPTVCLMIADSMVSMEVIMLIARDAIAIGCTFFMTWGASADLLHDALDEVIESGPDEWLDIITTSHQGKDINDVLDFLFIAAMPEHQLFRCLVIGDKPVDELKMMIGI